MSSSCSYILSSMVFDKKLAVNLIEGRLYVSYFSRNQRQVKGNFESITREINRNTEFVANFGGTVRAAICKSSLGKCCSCKRCHWVFSRVNGKWVNFPIFKNLLIFFSFHGSDNRNIRSFARIPQVSKALFIFFFFILFSLFFILGNFYCSAFQFIDSFLYHFQSTIEHVSLNFISVIIILSSKISTCFYFISSIVLLRCSIFSFVSSMFLIAHLSILIITAWKPFIR